MEDNAPNIGLPGAEFDAKEARWRQEIQACWIEFQDSAAWILAGRNKEERSERLREYAAGLCQDSAVTMRNYCAWSLAGKLKGWKPG